MLSLAEDGDLWQTVTVNGGVRFETEFFDEMPDGYLPHKSDAGESFDEKGFAGAELGVIQKTYLCHTVSNRLLLNKYVPLSLDLSGCTANHRHQPRNMNEEEITKVAEELRRVAEDDEVPANVRESVEEAAEHLLDNDREPSERAASSLNVLNDVSNDPNLPTHTRTLIWNVSGELETATVE